MSTVRRPPWRTGDVWAISLSAFFADLGYQAVLAGFPLFLVLVLHQPVWEYGLACALSYGGGALFSVVGARIGDWIGHRSLALAGNAVIPLLSLCALVANPVWAIGLLTGGWWARNLRSPSRRVMLVEAVPEERYRSTAFGFLHALDVGGGALAGVFVLVALAVHVAFRWIFLVTVLPLAISTITLSRAGVGRRLPPDEPSDERSSGSPDGSPDERLPEPPPPGARPLFAAAALYGFTTYSVGFPVLTVAQGSAGLLAGIGAFLVLQACSAATGYLLGGRLGRGPADQMVRLGLLGYLGASLGAGAIAVAYTDHLGLAALLVGVAVVGFALGIVETLEPTAISVLRPGLRLGRGMGSLSASRGVGAFLGNLVMGLLYSVGVGVAYGYVAVVAAVAGAIVLAAVPGLRTWQRARGDGGASRR